MKNGVCNSGVPGARCGVGTFVMPNLQ